MPRLVSHYFTRSAKFPAWRREAFKEVNGRNLPPNINGSFYEGSGFLLSAAKAIVDRWNAMAQYGEGMRAMGYEYRLDPPEDWIER